MLQLWPLGCMVHMKFFFLICLHYLKHPSLASFDYSCQWNHFPLIIACPFVKTPFRPTSLDCAAAAAAAAAAKSLQSCPTLCDPIDGSPPGSAVLGILLARTLEWVAISFSNAWKLKVKGKSLSHVQLLATPWTAAYQAPPSMGFSRQELLEWVAIAFSVDCARCFKWVNFEIRTQVSLRS